MRQFLIGGEIIEEEADGFQRRLTLAYHGKLRPLCLCKGPGVPMYIAQIGVELVIKRMPFSGGDHDPSCHSYEPPHELSGLGPLLGNAIKVDAAGMADLRLDFSLSKRGTLNGTNMSMNAGDLDSVRSDGKKLSLRALLHLLWHGSGLTEWTAHWIGKRHWWQVYHHLVEATRSMLIRGDNLSERLFVPEPFRIDDKAAIEQRRAQALAGLFQRAATPRKLMLLIGEVKEFTPARSGQQVVIKHMPGFRLHLEEITWQRLPRRFEAELGLWRSNDTLHLIAIATIEGTASGLVTINEISLMTVTEQWLPIENAYEERLLAKLIRQRGKMVKGLRFNLSKDQPLANAILPEQRPRPFALYIVPPNADDQFEAILAKMRATRPDLASWVWRVAKGEMPPLPWEPS